MGGESKRVGLDVGVVVRDLEASSTFYADVLGLPLHSSLAAPWPASRRHASGSSLVKLTEAAPERDVELHGGIRAGTGIRYFSVYVEDLDAVLARCVSRGVPVRTPRTEVKPGRLVAIVEDPDGNPIELVEQDEE